MLFHGAKAKTQTAMLLSIPDPKAKPVRRNGGYNNRGRGGRRPYSANRSEHNTPANPDRKPLNEGGATGLYGRIDK